MPFLYLLQQRTQLIRQSIQHCPFVTSIYQGTLRAELFSFYAEQDELYIIELARVLKKIARRLAVHSETQQISRTIYQRAEILNQEVTDGFFNPARQNDFFSPLHDQQRLKTEVIERYTKHLHDCAGSASVSLGLVAILPCYQIYRELGEHWPLSYHTPNHPYKNWLEANLSPSFIEFGEQLQQLTQSLAQQEIYERKLIDIETLLKAGEQSYQYEASFFNQSHYGRPLLSMHANHLNLR